VTPGALARGALALLVLALPAGLAAQRAPRVLLSVSGGTVPRDHGALGRERVAGLTGAAGLRMPVWRRGVRSTFVRLGVEIPVGT
jgi:hypothetical protein